MITTKIIDFQHKADINIPNEPFKLLGRILVSYNNGKWDYQLKKYPSEKVTEMCFPDENYDYEAMKDSVFVGAYDDEKMCRLSDSATRLFQIYVFVRSQGKSRISWPTYRADINN